MRTPPRRICRRRSRNRHRTEKGAAAPNAGRLWPAMRVTLGGRRETAARSTRGRVPPMDALTAAFALIIAQLCIALVMIGAHFAARPERCTQYWASAAILIVVGVLLVVIGSRAPPIVQLLG